jgi:hypothetical protein
MPGRRRPARVGRDLNRSRLGVSRPGSTSASRPAPTAMPPTTRSRAWSRPMLRRASLRGHIGYLATGCAAGGEVESARTFRRRLDMRCRRGAPRAPRSSSANKSAHTASRATRMPRWSPRSRTPASAPISPAQLDDRPGPQHPAEENRIPTDATAGTTMATMPTATNATPTTIVISRCFRPSGLRPGTAREAVQVPRRPRISHQHGPAVAGGQRGCGYLAPRDPPSDGAPRR